MKVIGAGFARTGTTSLKQALEDLGFGPCYHMFEVMREPERVRQWMAVADGKRNWDEIFAGYQSTVDWPQSAYWRELASYYPGSKVILTVRSPDRWYESAAGTIFSQRLRAERQPGKTVYRLLTHADPDFGEFIQMTESIVWNGALEGRFTDRAYTLSLFERHIDEVRAAIPADRLLVFDVAEGWEPLCSFLGVGVPEKPFPHANDTQAFLGFWREQQKQIMRHALVAGAAAPVRPLTSLGRRLSGRH